MNPSQSFDQKTPIDLMDVDYVNGWITSRIGELNTGREHPLTLGEFVRRKTPEAEGVRVNICHAIKRHCTTRMSADQRRMEFGSDSSDREPLTANLIARITGISHRMVSRYLSDFLPTKDLQVTVGSSGLVSWRWESFKPLLGN